MLSDKGDVVLDPFAGSCITGEVAEMLGRQWVCCELQSEYLAGAVSRFGKATSRTSRPKPAEGYRVPTIKPFSAEAEGERLDRFGGKHVPKPK